MNPIVKLASLLALILPLVAAAEESESVSGLSDGGQWVAAIAPGENVNRLLIKDIVSGDVFEVGDFSESGLEDVAWVDENMLALEVSKGIRVLQISPPDAEDDQAEPSFDWVQPLLTNNPSEANQPRWFENQPDATGSLYLSEVNRFERRRQIENGKKTRRVPLRDY